jgi:hypothetical protein
VLQTSSSPLFQSSPPLLLLQQQSISYPLSVAPHLSTYGYDGCGDGFPTEQFNLNMQPNTFLSPNLLPPSYQSQFTNQLSQMTKNDLDGNKENEIKFEIIDFNNIIEKLENKIEEGTSKEDKKREIEDEKRRIEEKRKMEDEKKRIEEEKKKMEDENKRIEDERRKT